MSKAPSRYTVEANRKVAREMEGFEDLREEAERGLVAPLPDGGRIRNAEGAAILDLPAFDFLDDPESADYVNPSLRLQGQLMRRHGLFKVCDGVYQVRGIGSSIGFIEGESGVIVVDSGMSSYLAETARKLYFEHRPQRPIVAMILSHTHGDHNGGMGALVDEADVRAGKVKIYAPEGYLAEMVSESLLAGPAARRRAQYMFGMQLPVGPSGLAGIGIGMANVRARRKALLPTDFITHTGQTEVIDGLTFEFQLAREAEAPVELHWFIPSLKALTLSENCEQTMHNTYTLRGAKTRNPLVWSKILQEALDLWGDKAEVLYSCHSWPVWGRDTIRRQLEMARDGYRFINDRTLHLAGRGLSPDEIGRAIRFPEKLRRHWGMRSHYGTLSHNARGAYAYYLGWYDNNPATLNPLPKSETAPRYVEAMGGAGRVLELARKAADAGDYPWAAELLDRLVFAEPENREAKELLADVYEQMGYQAESAPWRNNYLTAAMELRDGIKRRPMPPEGTESGMTLELLCDYLSVRLDNLAAAERDLTCNLCLTTPDGKEEKAVMYLSCGVISLSRSACAPDADVSVHGPMLLYNRLIMNALKLEEAEAEGLAFKGDKEAFAAMLACRGDFDPWFPIVIP